MLLAALVFFGVSLGEPLTSIEKRLGAPTALSAPNVYAWHTRGELLRVLTVEGKAGVVDVYADREDDRRTIELPEHGELQFNVSSHVNAQEEQRPIFFGTARMPLIRSEELLMCVRRSNDTLLAEYFPEPGDGGVNEIVFGTRSALRTYGIACGK